MCLFLYFILKDFWWLGVDLQSINLDNCEKKNYQLYQDAFVKCYAPACNSRENLFLAYRS